MKINWGTGIVIFIIMFVSGMSVLLYISFQQKINLVHEDYYPMEIEHQKMIDKQNNMLNLKDKVEVMLSSDSIQIAFPPLSDYSGVKGTILLYRPSDYEMDITYPIHLSETGHQKIKKAGLLLGKYILKIDWEYDNIKYFTQKNLYIR